MTGAGSSASLGDARHIHDSRRIKRAHLSDPFAAVVTLSVEAGHSAVS